MPMQDFSGDTFVAFTDIAGFKSMMKDERRGPEALDALYFSGYKVIAEQPPEDPRVEGLFVSDCGVLFVPGVGNAVAKLESLLSAIERLNKLCFEQAVSLTTSVAWGNFSYHQRFEILGIAKSAIYGNAYVAAFIDNESDSPKLYPNECRVMKQNLPPEVIERFGRREGPIGSRSRETEKYYYFEWMRR
jgi:hypothetical protein